MGNPSYGKGHYEGKKEGRREGALGAAAVAVLAAAGKYAYEWLKKRK
jgi:hypothetical protein